MPEIEYYVLDLETNGLVSKNNYHSILEISIIRASDKCQLTRFVRCLTPERSSLDALRVCNKTLTDLNEGITAQESINDVNTFLNSDGLSPEFRCIVGHNIVSFDRRFLWAHWESCNNIFPANLWLDTLEMSKKWVKDNNLKQTNGKKALSNLTATCEMLGLKKFAGVHAAKADSRNTYLVWQEFMKLGVDHLKFMKNLPHKLEEDKVDEDLLDL